MADPTVKRDQHYTYSDYRSWPEDERWELIEGVAWDMSPAPARQHQGIVAAIASAFYSALRDHPCQVYPAPFDVLLPGGAETEDDDVTTVVQPDVSVFCDESRLTRAGARGAPTLAVEILSPSTASKDMRIKRDLYERHGVLEYWIVDPGNKYVAVYLLDEGGKYGEPKLYEPTKASESTLSPRTPPLASAGVQIDLGEMFDSDL